MFTPHSNWLSFRSPDLHYSSKDLAEQNHSTKCKMLLFYLLGVDDLTIHVHTMTLHCLKGFLYHFRKEGVFPMVWNKLQPQFHLGGKNRLKISQAFLSSPKFTTKKRRENYWSHIPTCNDMQPFNQRERERPATWGWMTHFISSGKKESHTELQKVNHIHGPSSIFLKAFLSFKSPWFFN